MKNKVITIVCSILIICAVICFSYIIINSMIKSKQPTQKEPEPTVPTTTPEIVDREERGKNINVNSRIGVELKELIKYSDIYSNDIIDELDEKGISSKFKLLVSLDKIYRKQEYQEYLQYSEEYNSTYITPENMNKVINSTFKDTSITDKKVDEILDFSDESKVYIVIPRGFPTGTIGYTLEIPYQITEYPDRAELLAYRVYITKNIEMNEAESSVNIKLFYDKSKSILALNIENDQEFNENTQIDYIKSKIDDNVLDTKILQTVKYTFTKVDSQYRLSGFENNIK